VQSVDLARGRIALTMRTDGRPAGATGAERQRANDQRGDATGRDSSAPRTGGDRGRAPKAPKPPTSPAPVPGKGFVAPNGMRFK
jgi:hypothetical protein